MGMNIKAISLGSKDGVFEGVIDLEVRSRENLEAMLKGLKKIDGIQDVVRNDI